MAKAFRRKKGAFVAELDATERLVVVDLIAQTLALIEPAPIPTTGDPFADLMAQLGQAPDPQEVADRDPVLRRLLPDGHREDAQAAAEFRSATERSLRERKSANMRIAIHALKASSDSVKLSHDEALALMLALADVRLALGERLELHTDGDSEQLAREVEDAAGQSEDPRLIVGAYYDFLTWLQEGLALALMP